MFIFSIRSSTLKFCSILLAGVLSVVALVFLLPDAPTADAPEARSAAVTFDGIRTYGDMASFIAQFGWEVKKEPASDVSITVPENFSQTFAGYARMQKEQGLDLAELTGKTVRRVSFEVTNYPDAEETALATVFIYRERVVGADLSSADPRGFVLPLVKDPSA